MSQAYVRDLTGSKAEQGIDVMLDELPGMLSSATSVYLKLIRRAGRMVGDMLPADMLAGANECCAIPTQDCPPHCVAEIVWHACPGETQRATITVRNTSAQARTFTFTAGNLGPAQVQIAPAAALIDAGQSVTLQVAVPAAGLKEGETYTTELLVRGAYEQCVRLKLCVDRTVVPHLDLAQGDVPKRITELQWYRHWQCTDPCAVPARATDNTFNGAEGGPPPAGTAAGSAAAAAVPPVPRTRKTVRKAVLRRSAAKKRKA
ncbi:MAG TPA: hypothetical protein VMK32_10010 [Burkholderiaceae bacterium]|nr:hypothetical protein [Burkholderiaceae bacterium]